MTKQDALFPVPGASAVPIALALIDERPMERTCFKVCLTGADAQMEVAAYASVSAWRSGHAETEVILINLGGQSIMEEEGAETVRVLAAEAASSPVIVMSQAESIAAVLAALDCGAVGHVPPGTEMADVLSAVRLARSGGVFLPAISIPFLRVAMLAGSDRRDAGNLSVALTERQVAVAAALRRGATNKTIAYELDLCESTVKLHVRNIMQKLGVTNRTQAAYRLTEMMDA